MKSRTSMVSDQRPGLKPAQALAIPGRLNKFSFIEDHLPIKKAFTIRSAKPLYPLPREGAVTQITISTLFDEENVHLVLTICCWTPLNMQKDCLEALMRLKTVF
jgi:hypothetical protein